MCKTVLMLCRLSYSLKLLSYDDADFNVIGPPWFVFDRFYLIFLLVGIVLQRIGLSRKKNPNLLGGYLN
jgi:hypothetical protein